MDLLGNFVLSQPEKFSINGFNEKTPHCLPWCVMLIFYSVYISFLVPILTERLKKQKSTFTATDRILSKTICLCPLNTQSQSSLGPIHFFNFSFILFCQDSIYLNLRYVFVVLLLHLCRSNGFVIICAAVENCY